MAKLERIISDATLLGTDIQQSRRARRARAPRASFPELLEGEGIPKAETIDAIRDGDQGIARIRETLNVPRSFKLGELVSYAEAVLVDRDKAGRDTYSEMFETGIGQRHLRRKLRIENQVGPRDMRHTIESQSADQYRSIVEVTSNAIDFSGEDGKVAVSFAKDGYTVRDHGKGMDPGTIFEKLLIPTISGARDRQESIGKFGMGFMTSLNHLEKDGDQVVVRTAHENQGYQITFAYQDADIVVQLARQDEVLKGTEVTVRSEGFDVDSAKYLLHSHLHAKRGAEITADGKKVNNLKKKTVIETGSRERDKTAILFEPEVLSSDTTTTCEMELLINGVKVEEMSIDGISLPKFFAIDFPYTTSLPESRNGVEFDDTAHSAIRALIDQIVDAEMPVEQRVQVINAMSSVIQTLQQREPADVKRVNVFKELDTKLVEPLKQEGYQLLPALDEYTDLAVDNALYISEDLPAVDVMAVHGVGKCMDFLSSTHVAYVADFKPESEELVFVSGNKVFVDRAIYEKHKDMPALLNLAIRTGRSGIEGGLFEREERETADYKEKPLSVTEYAIQKIHGLYLDDNSIWNLAGKDGGYVTEEIKNAFKNYLLGETTDKPFDQEWHYWNDERLAGLMNTPKKLKLVEQTKDALQIFSKKSLEELFKLSPEERSSNVANWFRNIIKKYPGRFNEEQRLLSQNTPNDQEFLNTFSDYHPEAKAQPWVFFRRIVASFTSGSADLDNLQRLEREDPETGALVKKYADVDNLLNLGWETGGALGTDIIARFIKRDRALVETFYDDVLSPLKDHPLINTADLKTILFSTWDSERAITAHHSREGYSAWKKTLAGVPLTEKDQEYPINERTLMRWYFEDYSYHMNMEELIPLNPQEHIAREKVMFRENFSAIGQNAAALLNMDEVRMLFTSNEHAFDLIINDSYMDKKYRRSGELGTIMHSQDIFRNIEGHTIPLTPERLKIVADTVRNEFDADNFTFRDAMKLTVYLKRVMGSGNVPDQDFAFAQKLYLTNIPGHFNTSHVIETHIFHPTVIRRIHETFETLPQSTLGDFVTFWDRVNTSDKVKKQPGMELLTRALDIWDDVARLPRNEYEKMLRAMKGHPPDKYDWHYFTKTNYTENVPAKIRPYVIHYLDGEQGVDLEAESRVDYLIERDAYDHNISLTDLTLAKKLRAETFGDHLKTPEEFAEWIRTTVAGKDNFVARRELIHGIFHQSVTNRNLFIRELIQNSYDAMSQAENPELRDMWIDEHMTKDKYILSVIDYAGMDFDTIMGYLLVPEATTKNDGSTLGKFGVGFLSIFRDAEKVLIKTQKDGTPVSLRITPVKENDGTIADLNIEYSIEENTEDTNRTTIHKVMPRNATRLQSAFIKDAVIRYGTHVDFNVMPISFNMETLNTQGKTLAAFKDKEFGEFKTLDGRESCVTQGGIYVMDMPNEWISMIPVKLRRQLLETGFIIDLPRDIPLTRSRNNIASGEKFEAAFKNSIPQLAVNTFLQQFAHGHVDFSLLPEDYFHRDGSPADRQRSIDEITARDVRAINRKRPIRDFKRYDEEHALLELLTSINVATYRGKRVSLSDLAERIDSGEIIDTDYLPNSLAIAIEDATDTNLARERKERVFKESKQKPVEDFVLTQEMHEALKENGGEALTHFLELVRSITAPDLQDTKHTFYYKPDESIAHARSFTQEKGWNLVSPETRTLLNLLPYINKPEEVTPPQKYHFWHSLLRISTHEDTHLAVKSDHWGEHHNQRFYNAQRKILTKLLTTIDIPELQKTIPQDLPEVPAIPQLLTKLGFLEDKSKNEPVQHDVFDASREDAVEIDISFEQANNEHTWPGQGGYQAPEETEQEWVRDELDGR